MTKSWACQRLLGPLPVPEVLQVPQVAERVFDDEPGSPLLPGLIPTTLDEVLGALDVHQEPSTTALLLQAAAADPDRRRADWEKAADAGKLLTVADSVDDAVIESDAA